MKGFVVWFTGLSGSGKSTLATLLAAELRERGVMVEVLDGDEIRRNLSKGLGFSKEDRDTSVRRVGFVAKLLARAGACAITASISPYREVREEQRSAIGDFVEVYCKCSLSVLQERDPKGLYKKVAAGEIEHFTGVDDPYEPPLDPDVEIDTGALDKKGALGAVLDALVAKGYLEERAPDAALARPHGGELPSFAAIDVKGALALARLEVDTDVEHAAELLASGALAPVWGFLGSKDRVRVGKEMRLESGLPFGWPIGLVAPPGSEYRVGEKLALVAKGGAPFAVVEVSEVEAEEAGGKTLGATFVEVRAEWAGVADRIREEVVALAASTPTIERSDRVVGFYVGDTLDARRKLVLRLALATADAVVVLAADPGGAGVDAARTMIADVVPGARVAVAALPPPPSLEPERAALTKAILLKNLGANCIVVEPDDAPVMREALARFSRAEMGVSLLSFDGELLGLMSGQRANA